MKFEYQFGAVGHIDYTPTALEVEQEPMLRSHTFSSASQHSGPLTARVLAELVENADFINALKKNKKRKIKIDTKSVMLMEGMYPCIGGWHCDDVPRNPETGQPNIEEINGDADHFLVSLATDDICPTEFFVPLGNDIHVSEENVWSSVNKSVEELRAKDEGCVLQFNRGEIVHFNRPSIHRGTAATKKGWRYFFRLSFTDRDITPSIRSQVQVYTDISKGW